MVAILQLKASKLIVYFVSFTVVIFTILKNINKIKPKKDLEDKYTFIEDDKNDYTLDYDIDMSDIYKREYKFDNNNSILDSFSKIYEEHDIQYQPREKTQFFRVRYLLKK